MVHLCIICQEFFRLRTIYQKYLCTSCEDEFNQQRCRSGGLSLRDDLWCISLFSYSKTVASLVVRAKITRDYRALHCLTYMAMWRTETHLMANWADWVMPAPSSLTSRMRGSFDIADKLARQIADECSINQ